MRGGAYSTSTSALKKGEMVGFAGTNGSCNTMIRHIMGFLQPTEGAVYENGLEAWKHSSEYVRSIGYVPGEIAFPDRETVLNFSRARNTPALPICPTPSI